MKLEISSSRKTKEFTTVLKLNSTFFKKTQRVKKEIKREIKYTLKQTKMGIQRAETYEIQQKQF